MYKCPKYTKERRELKNTLKDGGFDLPCLDGIELPSLFEIGDRKIIRSVTVIVLNASPYVFLCSTLS